MARILIAEDSETELQFFKNILKDTNHTFIIARDGEEAEAKARSETPDLIILDVIMPQKSGGQALKEIKTMRSDIKAIFMSGYAGDKVINEDMGKEYAAFLSKPFPPEYLLSKIREVLTV